MAATRIVSTAGEAFGDRDLRARPRGRIAGASGPLDAARADRLRAGLGLRPTLLEGARTIAVDCDACLRGGRALETDEDWLRTCTSATGLAEVDGAFAVAWREESGALVLARDPIGHRTLYYAHVGGQLVFASRIVALLDAFQIPRRINPRSVAAFLSYAYVPGRETLVEGVFEVLPGEMVRSDGRSAFWALPRESYATRGERTDEELTRLLRAKLEEVIGGMLPRGEPVCASLSGGVDSSLVVALAQRLHDRPVRTFSITFGAQYKDELTWSSLVAEHCGTEHRVVELPAEAVVARLDDTIGRMDKPNGDPLTVPNALLFREMSEHGNVALNGEGGDPCFGGPKNLPMLLAELYGDGNEIDGDGGETDNDEPETSTARARQRTYLRAHLKCFDDLRSILTEDAYRAACVPPLEADLDAWFSDPRWESFLGKLMAINVRFKGGHHILPKVDALAAPFGVLPRSPLFAKSIVELAFELPPTVKLRGSIEKWILKRAVEDVLPPAIIERPKSGMLVPVEGWFQGPMLPLARERLARLGRHGIFRADSLQELLDGKSRALRPRRGVRIWLLVTLESHLRALGFA